MFLFYFLSPFAFLVAYFIISLALISDAFHFVVDTIDIMIMVILFLLIFCRLKRNFKDEEILVTFDCQDENEEPSFDEDFMQNLRDGQSTAEQRFAEASARLSSPNRELAFGTLSENEEDSETELRILLHRQNGDTETSMEVQPNEILQPGDVVEVILSYK